MSLPESWGQETVRLAILAPALAVRLGLRALLQLLPNLEIWDEAPSLQALEVEPSEIDILLTVEDVPDLEMLATFSGTMPAVLLLSEDPQAALPLQDYNLPAWGILPIDVSPKEIEAAIHALKAGLWVGDPVLVRRLVPSKDSSGNLPDHDTLTSRELEVLDGLSQGLANKQIGLLLGISEHTVKFHVSSIYQKLGATNRTEAVRIGIQKGWVTL